MLIFGSKTVLSFSFSFDCICSCFIFLLRINWGFAESLGTSDTFLRDWSPNLADTVSFGFFALGFSNVSGGKKLPDILVSLLIMSHEVSTFAPENSMISYFRKVSHTIDCNHIITDAMIYIGLPR